MHKKIYTLILVVIINLSSFSQELNCQVSVVSPQLQGTTNKQIFDQLQKSILNS